MGMTGVFEFFLVPSYQWHFEKSKSSGELASAISEEKMFDLRLDEQRHSIFLCRNGGFGKVEHFIWHVEPLEILFLNRA